MIHGNISIVRYTTAQYITVYYIYYHSILYCQMERGIMECLISVHQKCVCNMYPMQRKAEEKKKHVSPFFNVC